MSLAHKKSASPTPIERMKKVANEVAASHAAQVDVSGRFPAETFAALKQAQLLGVMIPVEFGGEGASLGDVATLCATLSQACGSSGMIYAMHSIKLSSLVNHYKDSVWHTQFMREVAEKQLLLGSATTEAGIGGDLRNSICAVQTSGDMFHLTKEATCISYGRDCDAILATARHDEAAAGSDQVMVVGKKGQYTLEQTTSWDTLGMRGTRSEGFTLKIDAPAEQVFPRPFAEIAAQSMLATTHILWASTWFGLANDAVSKAQSFVRSEVKKRPGFMPPGAMRLAEANDLLQRLKAVIVSGIHRFAQAQADDELLNVGFLAEMNTIKISSSQLARDVIEHALLITGLHGYRNDSPYSIGRPLRDALSAVIMINNDRILTNTSNLLLMGKIDTNLAI